MEKKKLREYTRIDDKSVNTQQTFGANIKCIASPTDIVLRRSILHESEFTKLNTVTPECTADVIDSDILLTNDTSNKDTNFEYEEEWDIGGIPELLNELDADIEKSLIVDLQRPSFKVDNDISISNDVLKPLSNKWDDKYRISEKNVKQLDKKTVFESSKNLIVHASTFTGFSKGGHLISSASALTFQTFTSIKPTLSIGLDNQIEQTVFSNSMSSQTGNNNNGANLGSGGISNLNSCHGGITGNSSAKSNTKMSIDHQATLDKGLKMKIKRTKSGTKSSEAKHEIVKATEQQQNGMSGAISTCNNNPDDNTSAISSTNAISLNSQNNIGNSPGQNITSTAGNKKNISSNVNQMNNFSTSGGNNCNSNSNSGILTTNVPIQSASLGTKRASSGHRRDKMKDKSSHSNRSANEKNVPQNNDKELQEKTSCNCNIGDNATSVCSSNVCNRRNESSAQRLSSSSINNAVVPPGVFIPSSDTPNATASATTLISDSTTVSNAPVIPHSSTISGAANTPGPPSRESTSVGNIKISSHIAAQLAAVAASNSNNGSSVTNTDIKLSPANVPEQLSKQTAPGIISSTVHHSITIPVSSSKTNVLHSSTNTSAIVNTSPNNLTDDNSKSPPSKRAKHNDGKIPGTNSVNKETVDICVGTSVGTITEPDCLGPCEPGTSVTLEGIVWHETEGGVLVVNVTWRGKTYVGTLLDCTRHDWAPPRFCDSPSDELDSRTPKGRGKRGRAVTTPDLSNFTETRSSIYFSHPHVHSKLRNGTSKGGRVNSRTSNAPEKNNSGSSVSSGNGGSTPSTSPTAFLPPRAEKRKSKDEPVSPTNADNDSSSATLANASGIPISATGVGLINQPQSLINPVTGLNVQISAKKCKASTPCAVSPVLLECPEQDCSKKYKHANGLRYHQSHAHGSVSILDDDSLADIEEPHITPLHSPVSIVPASVEPEAIDNLQTLLITPCSIPDATKLCSKLSETEAASPLRLLENTTDGNRELTQLTSCSDLLQSLTTQDNCEISNISPDAPNEVSQSDPSDNNEIHVNTLSPLEDATEPNNLESSSEKSGVLRFGQGDSKMANINILSVQIEEKSDLQDSVISQSCSPRSDPVISRSMTSQAIPDNTTLHPPVPSSDSFNVTSEPCAQNSHNQDSISVSNKSAPSTPIPGKPKKVRKSPAPTEFDVDRFNACNVTSREDVQSPAYSDISDDSTPVNDQQLIEKAQLPKSSDINKKSPDMALSSNSGCPSVQTTLPSPLGGYGVYQFYQQQQFLVQPSIDQPSNKTSLQSTTNIVQPTISVSCTPQRSPNNEINRKEPPLDLITKPTTSTPQRSSPTPQDSNKDVTQIQANNMSNQPSSGLPLGSGALSSSAPSKSVSHFYAFNYMSPNYPFNVDQNYVPVPVTAEDGKNSRHAGVLSPIEQQQSSIIFKDDRGKDVNSPSEKSTHQQQISVNKPIKVEPTPKTEHLKTEVPNAISTQISHVPLHNKDLQGMPSYSNIYQRHPMTLTSQQLSREEELRRYYIFSDQQRRQSSAVPNINLMNQQGQGCVTQSGHQQCKDDSASVQGNIQTQQQIKIKSNASLNMLGGVGKHTSGTKEVPKQKQEDDIKVIKQEGQKPTMETQGPPPPPTSQYFLHPSYIAPTPFGFDPNHPMYRNVLMPPTSPYNASPYHLPMPRYHAPEDLSRNTGAKALDVLHHAASQYYTTHKIHELSERALKSPNSSNSNGSNTVKVSVSSPTMGPTQHSNISANSVGHHSNASQPSSSTQMSHNMSSQTIASTSNKQEISGQKSLSSGSSGTSTQHNETQKPQTSNNTTVVSNSSVVSANSGGGADSRSPPPQRHVHTHHHTHVGLGYPMYPAPYGAAVLASQQAAAVAVINPFPPGPTK